MSESSERSEELDVDQVEDCCNLDPEEIEACLLYTSPSPRDVEESRMPSSA